MAEVAAGILAEIDREIDADAQARAGAEALTRVDLADISTAEIPPQRFIIDRWLPRGVVTLLAGHGGAGKSALALTWAACIAGGMFWCDIPQEFGRALYVSLEDRPDTVRRRLQRIMRSYGIDAATVAERLTVLDGSRTDGLLVYEANIDGVRALARTPLMYELEAAAAGQCLVIVDNASDAYGGNEIERRQVRAFVRMLGEIADVHDCAVLLLAHIDKNTAKFGGTESYSGSTAWHNSVRSRAALTIDGDAIALRHEKHNFSEPAADIALAWQDRVLVPIKAESANVAAETNVAAVIAALGAIIADGVDVPTASSGGHTTWHVLSSDPAIKALGKVATLAAITLAERQHRIVREEYRTPNRKHSSRWVIGAESAPMPAPEGT